MCQKGSWNRQYRKQARRRDGAEIDQQIALDLAYPDDHCPHGHAGDSVLDWCDDCHACPACSQFGTHSAPCTLCPTSKEP